MTGVAIEGLTYTYGRHARPAVQDVSLTVDGGEILSVVGPSGSGKSTLLRLVCGLLPARTGQVVVGGRDLTGAPPEQRPVAMVFQGFALFPHLDVAANIGFGLAVRKVPEGERAARVGEVAERLGLSGLLGRRPEALSGGERQRVALARALVRDPVAFCLDEPLSSLDPVLRGKARRDLDTLLREGGRCALYVTHDQAEALTLGDRVAVMRDGQVEQVGTPRQLYDTPATSFVASFIGSPPMSLLPAGTGGVSAGPGAATIGVRAEHARIAPGDDAVVAAIDDLGHERIAELEVPGGVLLVRLLEGESLARGDRTGFTIDPARVVAFGADGRAVR